LACAYARWSREARSPREIALRKEQALDAIGEAVRSGYSDWVWMGEDRDLDPIRDEPGFHQLVERMKEKFIVKPDHPGPPAPRPSGTPGKSGTEPPPLP